MSPTQTIIDRAKAEDAASIRELAIDAAIDAWSESGYREEITRRSSFVLKACRSGQLVGFLVARVVPGRNDFPDADLYNIAVERGSKRQRIGSLLLSSLISHLRMLSVENLWLEVRASNTNALMFYQAQGFEVEMERANFYSNPTENALIMRLRLTPKPRDRHAKTVLDSLSQEE